MVHKSSKQLWFPLLTSHAFSPERHMLLYTEHLHSPLMPLAQCGVVIMTGLAKVRPGGPQIMTGLRMVCFPLTLGRSVTSRLTAIYRSSEWPFGRAPSGINILIPIQGNKETNDEPCVIALCYCPVLLPYRALIQNTSQCRITLD